MQLGKLIDSRLFIAKINIADTCFNENVSVVLYTSDKITGCIVTCTHQTRLQVVWSSLHKIHTVSYS